MTTNQLCISICNQATRVDMEQWRWKISVEEAQPNTATERRSHHIARVQMHLHPTFSVTTVSLKQTSPRCFESESYTGWGTFVLRFDVHVSDGKDETKINLAHELSFANGGRTTSHIVTIADKTPSRKAALEMLKLSPFLHPSHDLFWHGRAYSGHDSSPPKRTWHSNEQPRDDHDNVPAWLTASEYEDHSHIMQHKVRQLAELLQLSKHTVIYSGAGISSAAGIGQAARGARQKGHLYTLAQPTLTHHVLTALSKKGYIQGGWLQQNHDGLPQKAGFAQEHINEIHGSWYDPSNPVVVYSGKLKDDEYQWMLQQTRDADLVLVLGTTLGGLNADQIAHETAQRSLTAQSLGTVVINLQQTLHDGDSTLRIFGQTDQVFAALAQEMDIAVPVVSSRETMPPRRVLVPYDAHGQRSYSVQTWWDLRPGARIKLTKGHNIVGAGQPSHRAITRGGGHVVGWNASTQGIDIKVDNGVVLCLGQWWIDAAVRGGPQTLPVVNI